MNSYSLASDSRSRGSYGIFYLEKNGLRFHGLHVEVVTVNLDPISGQGGPDPHGLGLLKEADHNLKQELEELAKRAQLIVKF